MSQHEELVATLKRRGFVQPSYDLYGGIAGFYDYGPLGAAVKHRLESLWRRIYVVGEGFNEISTPTVAPEAVFHASGHLGAFEDKVVNNANTGDAYRADHLLGEAIEPLLEDLADAEGAAELRQLWARIESQDATAIDEVLQIGVAFAGGDVAGPATITVADRTVEVRDPRTGDMEWTTAEGFNLMFRTSIGPGKGRTGYLRPETAQGMFVTFPWLARHARGKLPFGAVQIGRSFRNEISPRQGLIRLREFWQAEAEVFVDPEDKSHPRFGEVEDIEVPLVPASTEEPVTMALGQAVSKGIIANEMVAYFIARTYEVCTGAGVDADRIRFRQHRDDEMAHYAADCWDAEYHSSRYGWVECVGIADRGCYDLTQHAEHSGTDLNIQRPLDEPIERSYKRFEPVLSKLGPIFKGKAKQVAEALEAMDPDSASDPLTVDVDGETVEVPDECYTIDEGTERITTEDIVPHVIEPSYGVDRILWAALEHCWDASGEWGVLRLPPHMAPIQCAVLPLVSKDGLPEKAHELEAALRRAGLVTNLDEGGSIGRRYARMDEVGTPVCVTIDHDTLDDAGVTLRWRDTQEQARVPMDDVPNIVDDLIRGRRTWTDVHSEHGV